MSKETEALSYIIDGYPIGKRSRGRMALLCRRLHERVMEAVSDEKRDAAEVANLRAALADVVEAHRLALADLGVAGRWKCRFWWVLTAFIISLFTCISFFV